ncbi:MAG: HAD-IIIA family hydrolase, partial [Bacteroidales bacterium]
MILSNYKTLFLDRDGVINTRLVDDYVKTWKEFEFIEGVLEAISIFSKEFDRIFIVTNQQGIGKGIMSEEDLDKIHSRMIEEIEAKGGRIDKIYFCKHLAKENHIDRKPR